ncbi:MAG TPA: hypothetical protein PKY87_17415 [Terricaulis sp.]|nr:hypothetical protein [Terricaulis sp.]
MHKAKQPVMHGEEAAEKDRGKACQHAAGDGVGPHAEQRPRANNDVLKPIEENERKRAPAPKRHTDDRNKVKTNGRDNRPRHGNLESFHGVHLLRGGGFVSRDCARARKPHVS